MVATLPNNNSSKRVYSGEAGNFPNTQSSGTKENRWALILISSQKVITIHFEIKRC